MVDRCLPGFDDILFDQDFGRGNVGIGYFRPSPRIRTVQADHERVFSNAAIGTKRMSSRASNRGHGGSSCQRSRRVFIGGCCDSVF